MKPALAALRWIVVALVALLAVVAVAILVLTRTPWGVERVGQYAVTSLGRGIHGRLRVGRIDSRRLLGGVTLRDVSITDSAGNPFVHVDSARATYGWRSLLRGQIVLSSLELFRPVVVIEELPGDTLWNYEKIFYDTTTAPGAPRLVQFHDVTIHDGDATVAFPFEQKPPILPSDTARLIIRRAGRGLQRVLYFRGIDAGLPDVLWESPAEPGRLIKIARVSGKGFVWVTPFDLRQAAGMVALHDSVVAFDAREVKLPATQGRLVGRVVVHDTANDYDIQIATDRLAFSDLHWLYPKLPSDGGGSGNMRILTVPRGTLWLMSAARLHAPGTNVAGSFGIVTGDTLYFTQVSLRASPFDLKLVESILPGKLPIQGLLVGTVVVQGPLSALRTHGDLRLAGGPGGAAPSFVRWEGTVDLRGPYGATNFRADVDSLDLALLSALDPALKLRGALTGRIDADGRLDRNIRLVADVQHTLPGGGAPSHVTGSGNVSWTRQASSFDLKLEAVPVALDALAQAFPALRRLGGTARGPVTVKGSLADLLVDADLQTPAGRLAVNGRFDLASRRPAYHAAGELTGFHLDQIVSGLPETSISGRYRVDGAGSGLGTAEATVGLDLTSGRAGGVALHGGTLRLSLADGLARVDTLRLTTAAGQFEGQGEFGLRPGRAGTLRLKVDADSLGALQPLFFEDSVTAGAEQVRRMAGTLAGEATLTGGIEAFDVTADAALARARYDVASATRGTLRFTAGALGSDHPTWKLDAGVDSLRYGALLFPATTLHANYSAPAGSVALTARGTDGGDYALAGDYRLAGDTTDLAVRDLRFGAGQGAWRLTAPAGLRLVAGTVAADSLRLARAGGGSLRAAGRLAWVAGTADATALAAPLAFHLDLIGAPLEDFLGLAGAESPAGGRVTGNVDVDGTAGAPRIRASIGVDAPRFQELRLDRLDANATYADNHADGRVQALAGGTPVLVAAGRLPMDLTFASAHRRLPDQPIDFTVRADSLPASLATTLLDGFSGVRGRLDGQVKVGGTVRAPKFDGQIGLQGGAGFWLPSGVTYSGVRGTFRMAGDGAIQVDATAAAAQGTAGVKGRVVVGSDWSNPGFDLAASLNNFLAARRRDADVTASGDIRLGGRYRAPIVSGGIRVDRGVLNVDEVWRQYNILALDDSLLFNVVDTSVVSVRKVLTQEMESDFMRNLVVDSFTVDVGRDAWLRGKQMNVEVSGELGVYYRRAADDFRLTGTLSAVRGNYLLFGGRRFDVKSGTVEFLGTTAFDPNLDITAVYRARAADTGQPINIEADVTGTLTYPRVSLSSDQSSISQSDLVSYLWFGVPTYRLTPGQNQTIQAATAAVRSSIQGYLSSGLETVGRTIGLDYVSLTSGETAPHGAPTISARSFFSGLTGSQLEVGRYLGDNLFLALSGSRPAGTYATTSAFPSFGARLDWRLTPSWTGEFFVDNRAARVPSLGYTLDQTLAQQKVLGFFLYREWGY